jgi:hypothetical protein
LVLPNEPPTLPKQDGTGGTFNFQLHPAFWSGMAMCDDQSAPNPGGSSVGANIPCTPDSDTNIFDNSDPTKPDYGWKSPENAMVLLRMLHKAEEWKMIGHAPTIKLIKEHGRHLRLDDEAERRLLGGGKACTWRRRTFELFRDIVILMRDTGMRNQRELYRMRIENLDWENRVIFVPESKRFASLASARLRNQLAFKHSSRSRQPSLGLLRQSRRAS